MTSKSGGREIGPTVAKLAVAQRRSGSTPPRTFALEALVVVLTLAPFGPYILGQVRMEQLVTYPLALFAAAATFTYWRPTPAWWRFIALLGTFIIGATAVALAGPRLPSGFVARGTLAGLDSLLIPIAVLIIMISAASKVALNRILVVFTLTLIVALNVNALLAILQANGQASFGSYWSGGTSDVSSVAELAETNSRYSGVFNQPAEAGMVYGLGLICMTQLALSRYRAVLPFLPLIVVGGMLCGSKIFIVALGISFVAVILQRNSSFSVKGTIIAASLGSLLLLMSHLPQIVDSTIGRLGGATNGLQALTAGRLGTSDASQNEGFRMVLNYSPFGGFGIGGLETYYDSYWLESMILFGLIGLLLALLIAIQIAGVCWLSPREWTPVSRSFLLLLLAASLGFSPLTANRVAVPVWILLGIFALGHRPTEDVHINGASSTPHTQKARAR